MSMFASFGDSGSYQVGDTTTASNAVNLFNGTNSSLTYSGMLGAIAGVGVGLAGYGNVLDQAVSIQQTQQMSAFIDRATQSIKEAKPRFKSVLANLRSEIDGWHGDILERSHA